jgi:spermidine synthase
LLSITLHTIIFGMLPWVLLGSAQVPEGDDEIRLYQRGSEFSMRVGQYELMNSRIYGSEDALGLLVGARVPRRSGVRILIGGLGMGFTLAAVLQGLSRDSAVVVSELVPQVVAWNRGPLGAAAGNPLNDRRVKVVERDVRQVIGAEAEAYDAILLDVDNGPSGLVAKKNDKLYGVRGLGAAYAALRPGGFLAVWSSAGEEAFTRRLRQSGFEVELLQVRARGAAGGSRYVIWVAKRPPG